MDRLENRVKDEPDAIEKYFCMEMEKAKVSQMTEDDTRFFISLAFIRENSEEIQEVINELAKKSLGFKILSGILESYGISSDQRVKIFLSSSKIERAGDAVIYGTYLAYWAKKIGTKNISWEHFTMRVFPWGFPTEEEVSRLWDKQKIKKDEAGRGSDNLLDYASAAQSLIQK